jgi:hypothetical protein
MSCANVGATRRGDDVGVGAGPGVGSAVASGVSVEAVVGVKPGVGDGVAGGSVALGRLGLGLASAEAIELGLSGPAGAAHPESSKAIRAMASLRTSDRCRRRADSHR